MVFYAEDETPFGSLYWCLPTERRERLDSRLPIHALREILLGAGHSVFFSETCQAARSVPEQCFTLVAEDGFALNLKGESQQQRDAWVEGIKTVLGHCGRQVVELDEGKWEDQSWSKARRWIVHVSHVDESIVESLANGDQFTSFEDADGQPAQRKMKMWYQPESGRLAWSYTEQSVAEYTMELNQVLDVYIGKQRRVLQMDFAQHAKDDLCFSVVSRDVGLDLAAKDRATFSKWINGSFPAC